LKNAGFGRRKEGSMKRSLSSWFASGKSHALTLFFFLPFWVLGARMGEVPEGAGVFEQCVTKAVNWTVTLFGTLDTPTGGS
jgi:hypothetical protein